MRALKVFMHTFMRGLTGETGADCAVCSLAWVNIMLSQKVKANLSLRHVFWETVCQILPPITRWDAKHGPHYHKATKFFKWSLQTFDMSNKVPSQWCIIIYWVSEFFPWHFKWGTWSFYHKNMGLIKNGKEKSKKYWSPRFFFVKQTNCFNLRP